MTDSDNVAFTLSVGRTSFDLPDGRVVTAINAPDVVTGTIAAPDGAESPVDWYWPARVTIGGDVMTHGSVVHAGPTEVGSISVEVRSATALSESLMPPMVLQNLMPIEVAYAAARSAGFDRDSIRIDGLDRLVFEPFWVLAPLQGVEVRRPSRVGIVEFVDGDAAYEVLQRFRPALPEDIVRSFREASACARVAVVSQRIHDAELDGGALIDAACAWLSVRLRYSWSHLPDGQLNPYVRTATRVGVERKGGVSVLAVDGSRRWWRAATAMRTLGEITLHGADDDFLVPPMPADLRASDRHALMAIHRAATTLDSVARVSALWEAVEFFVSGTPRADLFTRDELAAISEAAAQGLSADKASRVREVLSRFLNQRSLMAQLSETLSAEAIPHGQDDLDVLRALRRERNRAVHGGHAQPRDADLDQAVAFMSRALVTRCAQRLVAS